jgi:hypothetical protein
MLRSNKKFVGFKIDIRFATICIDDQNVDFGSVKRSVFLILKLKVHEDEDKLLREAKEALDIFLKTVRRKMITAVIHGLLKCLESYT